MLNYRFKMRQNILNRNIPVRILKFLRKKFDSLILAYSGGTDSTLLLLVCKHYDITLDLIVWNNTKLEYVETLKYIPEVLSTLGYSNIFKEIKPEVSASFLSNIILEDFDSLLYSCKRYDKSDYRCCYYAKEKPMRLFIKNMNLDSDKTCILRGLKMVDNSIRMLSGLTLIEVGKFYHYKWKYGKQIQTSSPLQLVPEEYKNGWLKELCKQHDIPLPHKTGCSICPIFYRFANKNEKKTDPRFKIVQRFLEYRSKQKLPYWTKNNFKT